jgi:hypothetical protein
MKAIPVTLPPGRFRWSTTPIANAPMLKTIGMVVVAALAASVAAWRGDNGHPTAD